MAIFKNEELILKLFKREPEAKVSSSNIAKATGITKTELNRALNRLIEQGDLVRNGSGSKTSYSLSMVMKNLVAFQKQVSTDLNTDQVKREVGRPKKDPSELKTKDHVRISKKDRSFIEGKGFSLQSFLDYSIALEKGGAVSSSEYQKKAFVKKAFGKEDL